MLIEITGSPRTTNVRDNIIRDIDAIYFIYGLYCRNWTLSVEQTVIYLWLSHRWLRSITLLVPTTTSRFPSWRHVARNLQQSRISDASREHWTLHV